ncbi:MAG: hypothetical protein E7266_10925 [Lachnospiraceae bacterium]|nr:hypothetical protein [Lachnospiraceae bacterium]
MAETINLRENEYNQVIDKMVEFHSDQIEKINSVITSIRDFSNDKNYFSSESISAFIALLMDTIEEKIMTDLITEFEYSEMVVSSYVKTQMAIDDRTM